MLKTSLSSALPALRSSARWVFLAGSAVLVLCLAVLLADICRYAPWSKFRALQFYVEAVVLCIPLGLAAWLRIRPRSGNPFFFPTFVLSVSLGGWMFLLFLVFALGVYFQPVAWTLLVLCALWCGLELLRVRKRILPATLAWLRSFSPFDAAALFLVLAFLQSLFLWAAVRHMLSWDAFISWDCWASGAARAHWIANRIYGGYPQGISLLSSLFYKASLWPDAADALAPEHFHVHGFFVLYALELCLALLTLGRTFRFSGLFVLLCLFSSHFFWPDMARNQLGYADLPFAASILSALALAMEFSQSARRTLQETPGAEVALFCAFFAAFFTKGNSAATIPILAFFGAWLLPLRNSRLLKCLLAAAIPFALFLLHQWFFSRWTDWGCSNPAEHPMRMVTSHSYLFQANGAHLAAWLRRFPLELGIPDSWTWTFYAAVGLVSAFGLVRRRSAFFLLSAAALWAIWFYTASYELRNALVPWILLLVGVALSLAEGIRVLLPLQSPLRYAGVALVCAMCLFGGRLVLLQRPLAQAKNFSKSWRRLPTSFMTREDVCRRATFLRGHWKFLTESPIAKAAEHSCISEHGFRPCSPKGGYHAPDEPRANDLVFVCKTHPRAPNGYLLCSKIARLEFHRAIAIFEPPRHDVKLSVATAGTFPNGPIAPGVSIPFTARPEEDLYGDGGSWGVLELVFDQPAKKIRLRLAPESAALDPDAEIFASCPDGNALRLLFNLSRAKGRQPVFVLENKGKTARTLVSASLLCP